ncbi:MAG TPA: PAS domain S-box protein, partial [Nitrospirae bacterium]|nr:PAS domain S-box protein [Nitrospirota bacterium]
MYAAVAAGLLLAFLITRSITLPLMVLRAVTEKIGRGDLDTLLETGSKDEIGLLADSFNKMTADLKEITASRDDLNREIAERKSLDESLEKYRLLMTQTNDLAYICDKEGNVLYLNDAFENLSGHKAEEFIGKPFAPLFDEENLKLAMQSYKRTLEGESLKYELVFKDTGTLCEYKNSPLRDESGDIIGVIGIARDITDRKEAEETIQTIVEGMSAEVGQDFFERLAEFLCDWLKCGIGLVSELTDESTARALALKVDGKQVKDYEYKLSGTPCENVTVSGLCYYKDGVTDLFPEDVDLVTMSAKGYVGVPVKNKKGNPIGVIAAISHEPLELPDNAERILQILAARAASELERKQAESKLLRELDIKDVLGRVSKQLMYFGGITSISNLIYESAKELTGSRFGYAGYIDPATGHLVTPTLTSDIWDKCEVEGKDTVFTEFNGLWGWVLNEKKPLLTNNPSEDPRSSGTPEGHLPIERFLSVPVMAGQRLLGQIAVANPPQDYVKEDLETLGRLAELYSLAIERMKIEEELAVSEKGYRELFEGASESIFIVDPETRKFLDVNENAARGLGYSKQELLALGFEDIDTSMAKNKNEEIIRELTEKGSVLFEHTHMRKDGTEIPVEISSKVIDYKGRKVFQSIVRDISERKAAEKSLKEKSHALGERVKELNCLYNMSSLVDKEAYSLEDIFTGIADIIPPSWQY